MKRRSSWIDLATKLDGRELRYLSAILNGARLGGVSLPGLCFEIDDEQY